MSARLKVGLWPFSRSTNIIGLLVLVAFLGLWQLLIGVHIITVQSLPAPSQIVSSADHLIKNGQFQHNVLHTLVAVVVGWLIGSAIGLVLGCVAGLSRHVYDYTMASFDLLRSVPGVTLAPVAVLLFGYSMKMEISLISFVSIWPVLVATIDGTRGTPPALIELAKALRMSRLATVRKFVIPNALPTILVALRIALAVALAIAIVAEIVGNPDGIGAALTREEDALQPAAMFAYVIAASFMGLVLNAVLVLCVRLISPGTHAVAVSRATGELVTGPGVR